MKTSLFLFIHLIVLSASAQVFNTAISSATGGTGRAAVEAGDAVFLNPSTLVHLRGSFLNSTFAKDEFAVTLTDNSPASVMPASLGFVQKKSDVTQGQLEEQDIVFALSEFVVDKWSLGITGHYITQTIPGNSYRQINGDIGMMYTPKAHIGLGLVAYNIFGEKNDIPVNLRKKTTVGAGFNYIYEAKIRFRADVTSESLFMGGLESYLNDFCILRVGYSSDTDDQRDLGSFGVAFKGPRFALNYAYQGNPQNSGDYRHSVDLEIPF